MVKKISVPNDQIGLFDSPEKIKRDNLRHERLEKIKNRSIKPKAYDPIDSNRLLLKSFFYFKMYVPVLNQYPEFQKLPAKDIFENFILVPLSILGGQSLLSLIHNNPSAVESYMDEIRLNPKDIYLYIQRKV